jgi:hypothetical protein
VGANGEGGFKKGDRFFEKKNEVIFFEAALWLCTRGRLSLLSWRGRPALLSLGCKNL